MIDLEKKLGRPITRYDITLENVGFSLIVVNRIWGNLGKCKKELGLLETPTGHIKYTFDDYLSRLNNRLDEIKNVKNRTHIAWCDFEASDEFKTDIVDRHTIIKKFKKENKDFYQYIIDKGFSFCPYSYGFVDYMKTGEMVRSTFEYDYTNYLNELGFTYNKDYFRDVMYKTFFDIKEKINCDYMICIGDKKYYIEIAGLLYTENDLSVETTNIKEKYRTKMNKKLDILNSSNIEYLILYSKDMKNGDYREKTKRFLGIGSE